MKVPSFLQPDRDPPPARPTVQSALLDQIAADIAAAHPAEPEQEPFVDQLHKFGAGADRVMAQARANTDKLRGALAENAVLRARNLDLEQHVADLNAYWQGQYEAATARAQRLSRHYHSLTGAFDLIIDALHDTREKAKREAFTADEVDTPPRPADVEVQERATTITPLTQPLDGTTVKVPFDAERFLRDLAPELPVSPEPDDVPVFLRSADKLPRAFYPH